MLSRFLSLSFSLALHKPTLDVLQPISRGYALIEPLEVIFTLEEPTNHRVEWNCGTCPDLLRYLSSYIDGLVRRHESEPHFLSLMIVASHLVSASSASARRRVLACLGWPHCNQLKLNTVQAPFPQHHPNKTTHYEDHHRSLHHCRRPGRLRCRRRAPDH